MSNDLELWGIIPQTPSIDQTALQPLQIAFDQFLSGLFAPTGTGKKGKQGVCPDGSTNPMTCMQYLTHRNDMVIKSAQQRPLIRIADKDLNPVVALSDELSATFEERWDDSGSGKVVLRYNHWLVDWIINETRIDEDLHILVDPIPTQPDWRTRWAGKIHEIHVKANEDGTKSVELHAVSVREHAKKLLISCNPIFAPEVALPRMWILPGPTRTICFLTFMINLARIFVPGLSTITNTFNPAGWLNPLSGASLANFDPLSWPIQVAFVNPATDESRWSCIGATWTDWHSTTSDMLKDAGVVLRAYVWLPEDPDSPHTELADMAGMLPKKWQGNLKHAIRPTRPCVVFSLEDMSGQTGPTGTAIDGLLNVVGVTLDDMITSVLVDGQTGQTLNGEKIIDVNNETPLFASALGVATAPPKAIWRDGQFTGIISADHSFHKAPVKTVQTGGKSPALVNELQTFGIKYGIAQLSYAFTVAGGVDASFTPSTFHWQTPLTDGLDALYQGQLDNVLFAWERFTDPARAFYSGDVAYQEYVERGTGTAYTLAGILSLREGLYKTRAYQGFQVKTRNGHPWLIDVDVRLGERAGFEFDGIIYVDQITAVRREWDRQKPVLVSMSIGDDRDHRDPVARLVRFISGIWTTVGMLAGEGTIF